MIEHVVKTPLKAYPVYIGEGVIQQLPAVIKKQKAVTKILIITDEIVGELYLPVILDSIAEFQAEVVKVPSGEKAKTFEVYYECLTSALKYKLDRHSLILALGGGAVGDLSGFVAATFMRGIPFIQIPTTILAHDSAVGGKVAINHPEGKNMIGSFYQPEAVIYDIDFLKSLPLHERRSGFAEVIKHGLIQDLAFYQWLKAHINSLDNITGDELERFLARGIEIKSAIVAEDEKETGIRAYLNFGHTLGHAIEAEMGYGKMTHGEAVLIGMLFALQLSKKYAGLEFDISDLYEWVEKLGYQTKVPEGLSYESLVERMKGDKKSVGQQIRMVLLNKVGSPGLYELSEKEILLELGLF
ncbi:3-dehydroquinate synthase [Bacillus tuaregi]|uniref:3-dehydroquinate synthase n=1 Tax=Bacillus tuaregi TaxID=1816695 RepID=UPI0008F93760|nr:3-dehydroquinate synthase [Bacillus tuaregi]